MFRLNLKRFIKNKIMVSVVIVIFFLVTMYIYKDDEIKWTSRPYLPIQDSLKIMPVLFFLFMILSYEIFYQIKKNSLQEDMGNKNSFFMIFLSYFFLIL